MSDAFNLDRIGMGTSDRPPAELITTHTNAFYVHQLVQALREGTLGGRYDQVLLVGHSLGRVISIGGAA